MTMPNWVYSSITVTGDNEELAKFMQHISTKPEFLNEEEWNSRALSFHSFISLDPEHRDEYNGTHGTKDGKQVGNTEHNWYEWNNNNWFTKWDACSPDVHHDDISRAQSVNITFETAWSPPTPVYEAMGTQWPELTFHIHWEEEQGFGEEIEIIGGDYMTTDAWDSPDSHQDYENRGNLDGCVCAWNDDKEDWYDDCPREVEIVYEVHAITKYFIKAPNAVAAVEAAKAEEGGHDAPNMTEVVNIQYSEEYKAIDSTVAEPIEA
jgi:hypothetical protein